MNYYGIVIIIGRVNVGKSTILNKLIKKKLSIISHKICTTQTNIIGIYNNDNYQIMFIDTPGINTNVTNINDIRKQYNIIHTVDLVLLIVSNYWTKYEELILDYLKQVNKSTLLIINKIDLFNNKNNLLPYLSFLNKKYNFSSIIPICAKRKNDVNILLKTIYNYIPCGEPKFPNYMITNQSYKFILSELIREKIVKFLNKELPYTTKVEVIYINESKSIYNIFAIIYVKKISQKKIIIGNNGYLIKKINSYAKKSIEIFLNNKINLILSIKFKH
ncbi:MAG: GTPase Era [Candidatus Lightella neohaematopini]|nr:GTPase Era [Candidatus Lightella neohaematopini]